MPHSLQQAVVFFPVLLQIEGHVKQWFHKDASLNEKQRYQEPAESPISIQKRVYGLELNMQERTLHENWKLFCAGVVKSLKAVQRLVHLHYGRGNV